MKKVYCYFEALADGPPHQGELIRLWHRSWTRQGWDVRMLSPRTIWRSPLRRLLDQLTPKEKLLASRMISLVKVGGGLLVDYDVINYGLTPKMFRLSENTSSCGMCFMTHETAREMRKNWFNHMSKWTDYVVDYDEHEWSDASLVHFSHAACGSRPKFEVIENCGRQI